MKAKTLQCMAAFAVMSFTTINANADIILTDGVDFFAGNFFPTALSGPATLSDDYAVPDAGFVRLKHLSAAEVLRDNDCHPVDENTFACLLVRNGSTLQSAFGIYTTVFDPSGKSAIFVDGVGSSIEIGSATGGSGNIRLNGKGDFDITNGAVVQWTNTQNCNGDFNRCDIQIGATAVSNTGIRVIGPGSLLDASNTGGRLFVGYVPSAVEYTTDPEPPEPPNPNELDSEDFFVIADVGTVHSNGGGVGKGFEGGPGWNAGIGYVQGTAFIDDGSWFIQGAPGSDSNLNIGEGDGGSGNLIVVNGGLVDITANPGAEAGLFLGQRDDGVLTQGGSNLAVIDGAGSMIKVDNNSGVASGSRIANGFVTVRNDGSLQLDSSLLVVSGNSGAMLSDFNNDLASNAAGISGLANINLDVLSGGSVAITDSDMIGLGALIIGQTPDAGPVQSAMVRVSGVGSSITVSNDPNLAKIPLSATEFGSATEPGIPSVSNIGTGTLDIEAGGSVTFENGDFVIAARAGDNAIVTVDAATLQADRIVVGWTDFEGGAVIPTVPTASSGVLTLDIGIINGDVIVDDNGTLNGIGAVNGTVFAEGGVIDPGFSPGTITVESLVLGAGSRLRLEVGLNPDGSVNAAASDSIVATTGDLDLSEGEVTLELSSADQDTTLEEVLALGEPVVVDQLLDAGDGALTVALVTVTDSDGAMLTDVGVVNISDKADCKDGGWADQSRSDGTDFENQGDCIQYVNTGK